MPSIKFATTADPSVVSDHSRDVINSILLAAGLDSCTVTSTSRTPGRQALAMFKNIGLTSVEKQLALYGEGGDAVIREYQRLKLLGCGQQLIVSGMETKINEVGPSKVSAHCGDPSKVNVIDIAPSSIARPAQFMAALNAAKADGRLMKFFSPANSDPAYHIEIDQTQAKDFVPAN
jgi:hypothetical protein